MTSVGSIHEFVDGAARRVEVDGAAVCVVRLGDDWFAIGDVCSHADFSLSDGDVWADDCAVECPKHGAMFSLRTGEPQSLPATQPVPVFAVTITDDQVMVEPR
jgi:3-phenylpropionate/trans-cinnamate dioxygenase ferredoxin component